MVEQTGSSGQQIGNYRLTKLLGRGGFAEVYLADHIHLNTQAAVKLLNTRLANEGIEGFRNEARMIAGLIHPHIVRVLDFGVENSVPYLVMDYAPNGSLRQLHAKGARLPLPLVVGYVQQIASALQYAHEQRLIHRDIKPENMLVGRNKEVLLSDFGIALVAQSSHYQKTQDVAGTLAYMAPEQIQAHPRPASDQYSLGIVVYEWLGGQRPFQGTMTEIAVKHATAAPPPLRQFAPELPPAVEQVVLMALQKDPHARFPTVLAFAQALSQVSSQVSQAFSGGFAPGMPSQQSQVRTPVYGTLPSQQSQVQTPGYGTLPPTGDAATRPMSGPYSQPLFPPTPAPQPYPASHMPGGSSPMGGTFPPPVTYPPYTPYQSSISSQTVPPTQVSGARKVSRRTAIVGIAGGTVAVAGSGLAYYVYTNAKKGPTNPTSSPGSTSTVSNSSGTPSATTEASSAGALMTFSDHTKTIWNVAWSPDGKYIASASDDGTSHVWNVSTRQRVFSYRSGIQPAQSDDGAYSVDWLPDSTGFAVGFSDGTAEVVNLPARKRTGSFDSGKNGDLHGALYAVAFSPDGRYLAIAGFFSNDIQIFDRVTQQRVRALTGHTDTVWSLAWSHNGKYIASASGDATARVWDWNTGKPLLVYDKQGDTVRAVSWSPDDTRVVSGGISGPVYIWASDSGQTLLTYGNQDDFQVLAVSWSHHGKYIASAGGSDATTHVWNPQNGQLFRKFPAQAINSVSWSPDDTRIVTANNEIVQVWQI